MSQADKLPIKNAIVQSGLPLQNSFAINVKRTVIAHTLVRNDSPFSSLIYLCLCLGFAGALDDALLVEIAFQRCVVDHGIGDAELGDAEARRNGGCLDGLVQAPVFEELYCQG